MQDRHGFSHKFLTVLFVDGRHSTPSAFESADSCGAPSVCEIHVRPGWDRRKSLDRESGSLNGCPDISASELEAQQELGDLLTLLVSAGRRKVNMAALRHRTKALIRFTTSNL